MMLEMDLGALSRRVEHAIDVEEDYGAMLSLSRLLLPPRPIHWVDCFVLYLGCHRRDGI